jgi:tRNA pseudouridine-54 N-methylase
VEFEKKSHLKTGYRDSMSKASKLKRDVKKTVKKRVNNQKKAEVAQEKQKVPIIYFDESGNTGSNLLDKDQPVFTLASCKFSEKRKALLIS